MLVKNNAKRPVQHSFYNDKQELIIVEIAGGEVKEIQDDIAKLWLKHGLVVEYVEPKKAKEEKEELIARIKELEAQLKAAKKDENKEKEKEAPELESLKIKADELGITYAKNIGIDALTKKIDEFEAAKKDENKEGQTKDKQ